MSSICEEKITCPQCGKQSSFTIWNSLNADLNPEDKNRLISGDLFSFRCECGFSAVINFPMLYNDMTHKTMVYYVEEDRVQEIEELFTKMRTPGGFGLPDYRYRIVTSQTSLREKAAIFDLGLDDRLIEILKEIYFVQAQEKYPEIEDVFFFTEEGKWFLQFTGPESLFTETSKENYDTIHHDFFAALEAEGDEEFYVDFDWAINFLRRINFFS